MAQMELRSKKKVKQDESEVDSDQDAEASVQLLMEHGYAVGGYEESEDNDLNDGEEDMSPLPSSRGGATYPLDR